MTPCPRRCVLIGALVAFGCSDEAPATGTADTAQADIVDAQAADAGSADTSAKCPAQGCPCEDNFDCGDGHCIQAPGGKICDFEQCVAKADGKGCDDGDGCTQNDSCQGQKCVGADDTCQCRQTKDCAKFEDGNPCNGTLYCDKSALPYKCATNAATVVTCQPTFTPCHKSVCQPSVGECGEVADVGAACDDGDKCTNGELCDDKGACSGGKPVCGCQTDKDCPDDGDLCNGVPYCDKSGGQGECKPNLATVVECPSTKTPVCLSWQCEPKTGTCSQLAVKEKTVCSDGDPCVAKSWCAEGKCPAGEKLCKCNKHADCAAFEDGDACNGTLFCDVVAGNCKVNGATVVSCANNLDTQCAANTCDKATGACGMKGIKEGEPCDDGTACTQTESCEKGLCKAKTNVCTCAKNEDCAQHEDGNLCNGTLYCDLAATGANCAVNPASVVACAEDGNACTAALCETKTGDCKAVPLPSTVTCTDGNKCTGTDACKDGACVGPTPICQCTSSADCAPHEDGNLCNGTLFCDTSGASPACKLNPATIKTCPATPGAACEANQCDTKTGKCSKGKLPDQAPCDDSNPCTAGERCHDGKCSGGFAQCTCSTDAHCIALDDGNLCNGSYKCVAAPEGPAAPKICEPTPAVVCKGGSAGACGAVSCFAKTGKCEVQPAKDGTACEDGNPCTKNDSCLSGTCQKGQQDAGCCPLFDKVVKAGGSKLSDTAIHVVPWADGGVACGRAQKTSGAFTARLLRFNFGGNKIWDKQLSQNASNHTCQRIAALGTTSLVFIGNGFNGSNGQDAWLVKVDPSNGSAQWHKWLGGTGFEWGSGLATRGDNAIGAGFLDQSSVKGWKHARLTRWDAGGKKLWDAPLGSKTETSDRPEVAASADHWMVAFDGEKDAKIGFWLRAVDDAGKEAWAQHFAGVNPHLLRHIAAIADGGVLLVGRGATSGTKTRCRLVRTDKLGKALWDRQLAEDSDCHGGAALPIGLAVTGDVPGGNKNAWRFVLDVHGNVVWSKTVANSGHDYGYGVAAHPQGGILWSGARPEPGSTFHHDTVIARSDYFGHFNCPDSAVCLQTAMATCDDGNPCTKDGCDPGGCKSTAMADGAACGLGKTCAAGKCQ